MAIQEIGIRELNQNTSAIMSRVKKGETIIVKDHGDPVATITPIGGLDRYDRLIATGKVTLPLREYPRNIVRVTLPHGKTSADLIAEDRGDH
jgi:prevent-host-death family protein